MASIEEQLVESSKDLVNIMIERIGDNQELFNELMQISYRDEPTISMRAAWVASYVGGKHPHLVRSHINKLVKLLPKAKVDGVKRCALHLLITTPYTISEDILGELTDTCFTLAENPKQAIAIRAQSIEILLKVLDIYPEIKPELIAVCESIIPDASPGLKHKCRKIIEKF